MLNFRMSELIYSDAAIKNNINNMPDINALDSMLNLVFYCLQPIRNLIKKPIIVTSCFRCAKVNSLVGGMSNSQHLKGEAADFQIKGMSPNQIIKTIQKSDIEYDQLINEYDKWVHVSFKKGKNRKMVLSLK